MSNFFQRYKRNGVPRTGFVKKETDYSKVNNELNNNDSENKIEERIQSSDINVDTDSVSVKPKRTTESEPPPTVKEHLTQLLEQSRKDALNKAVNIKSESSSPNLNDVKKESIKSTEQPKKEFYETEAEQLGFTDLPSNLANSLVAWKRSNRPVVTAEQWNTRLSICRGCSYWMENKAPNVAKCMKCGCSSGKLLLASNSCPLSPPKWKAL